MMMMMMILKSVGAPFTGFWIPFRARSCAGLRCNCTAASFAVDWRRAQRILFKALRCRIENGAPIVTMAQRKRKLRV